MYHSHPCTYCGRIFYTYHSNKEHAAKILYFGIKQHLIDYNEDHKEYELDEAPEIEFNQMYYAIVELKDPPSGGYELK
ncbi:MAG: hypothetical protein Q8Q49_03045 [bacterium]|nr:hypothetical protein [bacterium]